MMIRVVITACSVTLLPKDEYNEGLHVAFVSFVKTGMCCVGKTNVL
jgi:hypothetical protein